MNAKVTLTCSRCGIKHTLKTDAYQKRLIRGSDLDNCQDCKPSKSRENVDDLWEFIKTALRLNAN